MPGTAKKVLSFLLICTLSVTNPSTYLGRELSDSPVSAFSDIELTSEVLVCSIIPDSDLLSPEDDSDDSPDSFLSQENYNFILGGSIVDTIKIKNDSAKMVAHRGLSGLERENTCPAFVAAGNRSYYGIETDIHKTTDGQFVVIHDETTKRVSLETVDINVEENPYSAMKDILLPDKDGSFNRQDIRIPLLIDYIKICKKYDKKCVLELKNEFEKSDIEKIVEEIRSLDYLENVIFISFRLNNCIILRSLLEDNDIQWLTKEVTDEVVEILKKERLNLDVYYKSLTKEIIDMLHSEGIKINCWTCDDKETAEQLATWGVDFITSNILE